MTSRVLFYVLLVFVIGLVVPMQTIQFTTQESVQEEKLPTGDNGKRIKMIRKYIGEAGKLYKDGDYNAAGKKISSAQKLLERAIANGREDYRGILEKEYRRVAKAHELLSSKSVSLSELRPMPEKLGVDPGMAKSGDASAAADSEDVVSFKSDVAPLLVKHCGTCHVKGSRGEFSMRTFDDLMKHSGGDAVVPGKPDQSEVIALIEDGSMPPRKKVPTKELKLIRKWIEQGAKFDSDDENKSLDISKIRDK